MFKKALLFFAIIFFSSLTIGSVIKAEDPTPTITPTPTIDVSQIQKQIDEYSQKLTELGKAKNTLANQLQQIDYQSNLTQLKITQTEKEVNTLESEIANLTININNLDINLNQLSSVYIYQIVQNYKLEKRTPKFAIFAENNFNDFLNQYKYLTTIQQDSQDTLLKMETTRTSFDMQKTEKEKKQIELEDLKKKLAAQKVSLSKQKDSKNKLMEVTKNDEKKYQQLLAEAQSQLSALKNFSSSAGSSCLSSSPGVGNDGNFFSQRDPRWCTQRMGNSPDTIGAVGCYISSISMVFKKIGFSMTPSLYALDPSNFVPPTAYAVNPTPPSGYTYKSVTYSSNTVDNELKSGRYVIAQMRMPGTYAGMHFIVIISGSSGKYKIHDPWYGPDMEFNTHYSTSQIMSLRLITK